MTNCFNKMSNFNVKELVGFGFRRIVVDAQTIFSNETGFFGSYLELGNF
ncbi:hypothetical protein SRABI130_01466 [Pseudomonas sp. Bi130]|nr:hypothetical protein SRABI130_01466 [Pseudomonas sp. Bi130]